MTAISLETLFTQALGIEGPWKITSLTFDAAKHKLDINVDFERGSTFAYTDPDTKETGYYKAYDTVDKTWRHLNFFEHECYLHARTPRIKTPSGGIHLVAPPWSGLTKGFTLLFEAFLFELCRNMVINQVGKMMNVTDHKLWSMLERYIAKARAQSDHSTLTRLGIDETSIAKGHDYISLFVDVERKKTVFITHGKDNTTVTRFVEDLEAHQGKAANITDVSCDMSAAFTKGVTEQLPDAQITYDRFHVIKVVNEGVDAVRRMELKTTPLLKGARYALLKNEATLTKKQKAKRESLSQYKLKSMRALHIREAFQDIYQAETEEEFTTLLKRWYYWATHSKLKPMIDAARTIKRHWDGIVAWKKSQITNGLLEGLNSIIQAAKRKARGYKLEHFKVMAYLLTGKLNFRNINPFLPTCF